jgi:hypothetical protein
MSIERALMATPKYATGPTVIGQAYGGGYYAGKISVAGNGVASHYLIVAPKSSGENSSKEWKNATTNSAPTSVIDGPTNSSNMNNTSHPAAYFCEGLTIDGYSDWYMPAKNELEVLYYFLKPTTGANNASGSNANAVSPEPISTFYSSGSPAQTSAAAFQSGGAEAFAADVYWASTQTGASSAWYQNFSNGAQGGDGKYYLHYVRAVRRIPV